MHLWYGWLRLLNINTPVYVPHLILLHWLQLRELCVQSAADWRGRITDPLYCAFCRSRNNIYPTGGKRKKKPHIQWIRGQTSSSYSNAELQVFLCQQEAPSWYRQQTPRLTVSTLILGLEQKCPSSQTHPAVNIWIIHVPYLFLLWSRWLTNTCPRSTHLQCLMYSQQSAFSSAD